MEYQYRSHRVGRSVPPELAAKELRRIQKKHGTLEAATVVEEARPEGAILHPVFMWNDAEAAEEYRRMQARQLIRAIVVVTDGDARPVYHHVPGAKGKGSYETAEVLVERPDLYALALSEALHSLTRAQERISDLRRLAEGDPDRAAVVVLAAQALQTAEQALRQLH